MTYDVPAATCTQKSIIYYSTEINPDAFYSTAILVTDWYNAYEETKEDKSLKVYLYWSSSEPYFDHASKWLWTNERHKILVIDYKPT